MVSSSVRQLMHNDEPALVTVASGKYATIGHWGAIPKRELAAARRRLAEVGARDLADRRWEVLSQGERQRVLIARALMAQPRLLILDEPCAGLDPLARERFLELIDELTRTAAAPALVFVTHHVEEIMPRFTHALLLRAGKVAAQGVKEGVLTTRNLTETFGAPLEVRRLRGRYSLRLRESAGSIRIQREA
jgi:iron complex transport system ATP-binding protein